ncbi:MAG: (4Fe-4S)-binding protein [Bacteroidota bacterium]
MSGIKKEYSNGEITVVWQSSLCTHSACCVKGLPQVFQPKERPWVKIDAASSAETEEQVKKCPSGALSFYYNKK